MIIGEYSPRRSRVIYRPGAGLWERGVFGEIFPKVMIFHHFRKYFAEYPERGGSINDILYRNTKMFMQNLKMIHATKRFFILKFVDSTRAIEYIILYFMQHACVPRVSMKYKIYLMAHALRAGLSQMQ